MEDKRPRGGHGKGWKVRANVGEKTTPGIITSNSRKEDRVIYNDTLASPNGDRRYVRWNTL